MNIEVERSQGLSKETLKVVFNSAVFHYLVSRSLKKMLPQTALALHYIAHIGWKQKH